MKSKTIQGLQRVSFDFWTTTGPRQIQAGVTIDYSPASVFEFESRVSWPTGDDYSAAVYQEAQAEIRKHCSESFGGRFILEAIRFHDVGSSESAFRIAVREAVRSLFSMSKIVDYDPPPIYLKK